MSNDLTPQQAQRFIGNFINRNGYGDVFPTDIGLMLQDNRRVSRSANVIKYSRIPFAKDHRGRVTYKLKDLQILCDEILEPICSIKLAIKLAKAEAAAKGLKYFMPYKFTREGIEQIRLAEERAAKLEREMTA